MRFAIPMVLAIITAAGCQTASVAGTYNIEQDGYGFGEGAEKIELDLQPDKTFAVNAGRLEMLKGSYEFDGKTVTFSQGQGAIAVAYRPEGGKLIPMKDGKDVAGWRWKRK